MKSLLHNVTEYKCTTFISSARKVECILLQDLVMYKKVRQYCSPDHQKSQHQKLCQGRIAFVIFKFQFISYEAYFTVNVCTFLYNFTYEHKKWKGYKRMRISVKGFSSRERYIKIIIIIIIYCHTSRLYVNMRFKL